MTRILMSSEVEVWSRVKSVAGESPYKIESNPLVFMQINCRSVYNKALEFWNLSRTIPMLL